MLDLFSVPKIPVFGCAGIKLTLSAEDRDTLEGLGFNFAPRDTLRGEQSSRPKGETSMARRRFQAGNLELRGETWTVRFREDVIQPNGKTKRIMLRRVVGTRKDYPTRKLALRRANEFVSHVNRLDYKPTQIATLSEFVEVWQTRALALLKRSTQKAAKTHLRAYLLPALGRLRLDEIGPGPVQALVAEMAAKGLSRHLILNVIYSLRSMLNSARRWGYAAGDFKAADLTIPAKGISKATRFFTATEAAAIIRAARQPWKTVFAISALCGLRPGETLGLTVEDLDFEKRLIHIRQTAYFSKLQTPKTRSSVGVVPMPAPLETLLREYLQTWKPNPARLLFATSRGTPYSANNLVQRELWPILDELQIERTGLYSFRHGLGSLLHSNGASLKVAQNQLRHADAATTARYYLHTLDSEQREAAEKAARILLPDVTNCDQIKMQPTLVH